MANADTPIPKFKAYADGEPIPPVDPEDIKRMCEYERTHSRVGANGCKWLQGLKAAISPEADSSDVSSRHGIVETLTRYNKGQLMAPWHQGEELHEAVFRIAATFPLRYLKHKSYMISGDEHFGLSLRGYLSSCEFGVSYSVTTVTLATAFAPGFSSLVATT